MSPSSGEGKRRIRKLAVSAFVLLNIFTVLLINAPENPGLASGHPAGAIMGPRAVYAMRWGGWLIRRYAHLAGLDNRWTMFTTLHRFDWRYVIQGRYGNNLATLPLPRQSQRTFWQRNFEKGGGGSGGQDEDGSGTQLGSLHQASL